MTPEKTPDKDCRDAFKYFDLFTYSQVHKVGFRTMDDSKSFIQNVCEDQNIFLY